MNKIVSNKYFDWAATAPFDTEILEESLNESFESWGNPSSIYQTGKNAKNALNAARDKIAKILNVDSKNLFFTSGGTESDHIPLLSILNNHHIAKSENGENSKGEILVSSIEHPALREQCAVLTRLGYDVKKIQPNKDGIVDVESVSKLLTEDTLFVSVMAVNNETGAVQPIYEIAKMLKEKSAGKRKPKFHVDAVQALGKIPLDIKGKLIDSMAFSAHKIGGPRGIGLLYIENPSTMEPFLRGGGQEQNVRSGTENVFGATAFSKCIEKYAITEQNQKMQERFEEQKNLTNDFIKNLSTLKNFHLIPESRLNQNFSNEHFSPWVIQAAFDKIPGQVMVRALDAKGFSISTGSACSSKKNSRPILEAMNVAPALRENAVRFSFGSSTTKEDIDQLFFAVEEIAKTFM